MYLKKPSACGESLSFFERRKKGKKLFAVEFVVGRTVPQIKSDLDELRHAFQLQVWKDSPVPK